MTDALFSVDVEARTIAGLLVPFGELSETSMNGVEPVMFSASTALELPTDPMVATLYDNDHDRFSPRGRGVEFTPTDAGIVAKFSVARDAAGDALLERAQQEPRPKLSAEIAHLVRRGTEAVSGVLTGASIVTKGAFASAALFSALGDVTEEPDPAPEAPVDPPAAPAASTTAAPAANPEEAPVAEATVPNTLLAGGDRAEPQAPAALTIRDVDAMMVAHKNGMFSIREMESRLEGQNSTQDALFALNQVKFDGAGGLTPTITAAPQWMGEVWTAAIAGFKQLVLPLFDHKDLTQMNLAGWKWTTEPTGGDFAGNGGNVPSNTLAVAPVTKTADRYAVGHSFGREFTDFPQPGFFESYTNAVSRNYLRWADAKVASIVNAAATPLAGDLLATIPGNPAATATNPGGTIGNIMSGIVDGAAAIVTNGILPTFALLNPTDWKKLVKLPRNNVLGYLNAALGVPEGSLDSFLLRPSAAITAGKALVGVKAAATVYELPGIPVRVDALNIAQGNIDEGAFGYCATVVNDAAGLQLVTFATT